MNILTAIDTDRHRIEWQTLQEKKQNKLPPHEKILMPPHIAHICLCLLKHKPSQRQSQKSAIAKALIQQSMIFSTNFGFQLFLNYE